MSSTRRGWHARMRAYADPHTWIYGTVIVMAVVAVYEPEPDPHGFRAWWHVFAMTIGPLLALAMAHGFAEWYDDQIRSEAPLTGTERRALVVRNARYLVVAIPPLVLDVVLWAVGASTTTAVSALLGLGMLSLMGWGWVAGTRVHAGILRRTLAAVFCGLAGAVVIVLELVLRH